MRRLALLAVVVCCGALASPAAAAPTGPLVRQLVAFKDGSVVEKRVRASAVSVRVGARRCAIARAIPLAALVRSRPGPIGLRDYGACSSRAHDSGQLFVRSIRRERNRGLDGWVYKVGRRLATAGAADPAGPFGRGRLTSGRRVTWFDGRKRGGTFQRTLELTAKQSGPGTVAVRARGYDDDGRGVAVAGADVTSRGDNALTDATGAAVLQLPPGTYLLRARKRGLVPSFGVRVTVR